MFGKKKIRNKFVLIGSGIELILLLLVARFHLFFELPVAMVRFESVTSLLDQFRVVYYTSSYIALFEWNEAAQVKDLRAALEDLQSSPDPNPLELGKMYWHLGDFVAAVAHLEEHHGQHQQSENSLFWLAMSYMRLAEANNCLDQLLDGHAEHYAGEHSKMCALPLTVYHRKDLYSRKAAHVFNQLLDDYDNDNPLYHWLLNFSYMTIDEFPAGVPQRYRLSGNFVDYFYGVKRVEMEEEYAGLALLDQARELGVATFDAGSWTATDPAHRARHISSDLRVACMDSLYARPDCEIVMGYVLHTFLPIFENTNRGATVIGGHDGGMHVNNGSREAIFAGFTLNPEHTPRRIAPAETLPWAAFVKDEILKPLSLETITGAYPNTPIVGPPGTDYAMDGNWRIDYRLAAEGESLHIVHILGSEERAKATDEGLAALLSVAPQKEHVFAYVLADKVALVRAMRKLGFQITAYLPAWHYTEHGRCDCLQVVRCTSPKTPTAPGLEQEVERFTRELNRGLSLSLRAEGKNHARIVA